MSLQYSVSSILHPLCSERIFVDKSFLNKRALAVPFYQKKLETQINR